MQKHNFIFLILIAAGFFYSSIAEAAIYYLPHPETDNFNARKNDALGRNVVCRSDYKYKCTGTGYSGGSGLACKGKYASCKCDTGYKWSGGSCIEKTCSDFGYLSSEDTTKSCTKIIGSGSTSVSDKLVPGYIDSISKVTSSALSSSLSGNGFTNTTIGGNANIADSSFAGAADRVMMNASMPSGLTCYKCTQCNTSTYKYSCSGTGYASSQSGATCNSLYTKCACDTGYTWSNGKCEKIICQAGFYLNGNTCTECKPGRYSASGDNLCTLCAPGTYAESTGSTSCTSCPAGWTFGLKARYGATSREEACIKCAAGTYKSGVGSGKCIDCPIAKPNSEAGSTSIDDCYSTCTAKSCSSLGACNGLKCTGFSSTEITSASEIGEGVEVGGFKTCKAINCLSSQTYYQNGFVVTTCKTDKDGWTLNSAKTNCDCTYKADDAVYKYAEDNCTNASCSLGCNDKYKFNSCNASYYGINIGTCQDAVTDCATLGYTQTSCSGDKLKCPFSNKYVCF